MMPRLGEKYDIQIETISKTREEYNSDEYSKPEFLLAPAIMVGEEIVVEKSDISEQKLESVICNHLGLPPPKPQ